MKRFMLFAFSAIVMLFLASSGLGGPPDPIGLSDDYNVKEVAGQQDYDYMVADYVFEMSLLDSKPVYVKSGKQAIVAREVNNRKTILAENYILTNSPALSNYVIYINSQNTIKSINPLKHSLGIIRDWNFRSRFAFV